MKSLVSQTLDPILTALFPRRRAIQQHVGSTDETRRVSATCDSRARAALRQL